MARGLGLWSLDLGVWGGKKQDLTPPSFTPPSSAVPWSQVGPVIGRVDDATMLALIRALTVFLGLV